MAKVNQQWQALPHKPIEKLEDNLWCVTGTLKGMALKRVMTLVRLQDCRIVIHSAIALDEAAMKEIEAWGTPAILLVPNGYHRLDAPAYLARYPDLQVMCPKGSRKKVAEVVQVDGDYDTFDGDDTISLEHLDGVRKTEGVAVVRSSGKSSLIINDAMFNMPHGKGIAGFVFRYITGSTGGPRVSRLFRWLALKEKAAFRAHLERLAETPDLRRVIVSHHRRIVDDPAAVLRNVAAGV